MFLLVLVAGSVIAADDGWGEINNGSAEPSGEVVDSGDDYVAPVSYSDSGTSEDLVEDEFYTTDFYIALGLIILVLIIVGVGVWLFLRGPKNKWDK